MKLASSIALGLLTVAASANPNYINTVRQIQQDTGVEWDVTVAPAGEMLSSEGVGPMGSDFELWTLSSVTGHATFLDSEFVSAYTPEGEVEIITGDPYSIAPRTRVDKPFTVTLTVDGLLDDAGAPPSALAVDHAHTLFPFPDGQHGHGEEAPEGVLFSAYPLTANGVTTLEYSTANLTGPDLTEVEGEEIFSLYTVAGGGVPAVLLDEKMLTVWPVAKAEIHGIQSGVTYAALPPVTIQLTDLYPDSTTFVRIYQGGVSGNPTAPVEINDADLVIYDAEPQDRALTLTQLSDHFTSGGIWTIEVLHRTPWGVERLTYENPEISDSIRVRAGIFTK